MPGRASGVGEQVGLDLRKQKIGIYARAPMVTSVTFLTQNAARVQAQLSHKSPWDLKNFGWMEEISFTPPQTLYLCGVGVTCVGWGMISLI